MTHPINRHHRHQRGFTLIELLIVIAVLSVVTGGIFLQLNTAQERINTEQVKVDNFDEARDFVDQFFHDINQIGYPSQRMVSFLPISLSLAQQNNLVAVGLVKIDQNAIWFEGDVDGTGVVQSVQYQINGSGNTGGAACTLCFQRSEVAKQTGSPLTVPPQLAPVWGTEVNDVITTPIFTYYQTDSTVVPVGSLPADISSNPTLIAKIKTIHISLSIQDPAVLDPKTRQPIQTVYEGEVSINNCSMAVTGYQGNSCE